MMEGKSESERERKGENRWQNKRNTEEEKSQKPMSHKAYNMFAVRAG